MRSTTTLLALAATASLLPACGGGESSTATTTATTATATATAATATAATAAATTTAATTTAATTTTTKAAAPAGPTFATTVEPTMAALAAVAGKPFTVAATAPALAFPANLPVLPNATTAGAARRNWKRDDAVRRSDHVGLQTAATADELKAFATAGPAGWKNPSFASSGRLSTALLTSGTDRLTYVHDAGAPATGRPPVQATLETTAAAITPPAWLASLPAPAGGTLVEVYEATGLVGGLSSAPPGKGGHVSASWEFPASAEAAVKALFTGAAITAAGFTLGPSPISNLTERLDVTMGPWKGTVSYGEGSSPNGAFIVFSWVLER
ncbi:MAG: hypothetical protein ACKO91_02610 [Acidimicrobiales bacterium]